MWLLIEYIDSEFPDYDIVSKKRLIETKYGKKQMIHIRGESGNSVYRAVIIQESEQESRLKVVKDMLLKEHRERRAAKKERSREEITVSKRTGPVPSEANYNSTDSETNSDSENDGKVSKNSHKIRNGIGTSFSCSTINEPQSSSEASIQFRESPKAKVEAEASTSTPYPADSNTSFTSHIECADQEVQAGPDRMTKKLEEIVSNGIQIQKEMYEALKIFDGFRMKFPEELNDSALSTLHENHESSPDIRRPKRRKRVSNSAENSCSLSSSELSDRTLQPSKDDTSQRKKMVVEKAESVRQRILKVLNMFDELDSYPEAYMYRAKEKDTTSSDDPVGECDSDEPLFKMATSKMVKEVFPNGSIPNLSKIKKLDAKKLNNIVNRISKTHNISKQAVRAHIKTIQADKSNKLQSRKKYSRQ